MRRMLELAALAAVIFGGTQVMGQVVDPDVVAPGRRAAAGAAKAAVAPGVEDRIERREERRDLRRADENPNAAARVNARAATPENPDRWRYRYHNNQWWYYTPQNRWMFYRDNNWSNYDAQTYVSPAPRYTTGYRGPQYDNRNYDTGNYETRSYPRRASRRGYAPAPAPYSNGTRAGNFGANLGAGVGAAVGPQATDADARSGADIGSNAAGAIANPTVPVPAPANPVPATQPAPNSTPQSP